MVGASVERLTGELGEHPVTALPVTALVVLDPGAAAVDEAALVAHCLERLAGYECPKRIEFRAELARTATGKLQKYKLREEFWSDRDRDADARGLTTNVRSSGSGRQARIQRCS